MAVEPPVALNPSDVVFLFGHRFAEAKEEGRAVPCSEVKVGVRSLVTAMMAAAFVSLSNESIIVLSQGQRKRLFVKTDTAMVSKLRDPEVDQGGLEGAILGHITVGSESRPVGDVMRQVIGRSAMDPFSALIAIATEHATSAGYFGEDPTASPIEKFFAGRTLPVAVVPNCERIAPLADRAAEVKTMLATFQGQNPGLYDLLCKDIQRSIRAAYMST